MIIASANLPTELVESQANVSIIEDGMFCPNHVYVISQYNLYCIMECLCISTDVATIDFEEALVTVLEGENVSLCIFVSGVSNGGLGCEIIIGFNIIPGHLAGREHNNDYHWVHGM